jgi:hypothetical protein
MIDNPISPSDSENDEAVSENISTQPESVPTTIDSALDKAFSEDDGATEKVETKRNRDPETGKYTAETETPVVAAPATAAVAADAPPIDEQVWKRFPDGLKKEWSSLSETAKAELTRMATGLVKAADQSQERIQGYSGIEKFDKMARNGGTTLEAALTAYTNIETLLRRDWKAGITEVAKNIGVTPQQLSEAFGGQPATPAQPGTSDTAEVSALKQLLAQTQRDLAGLKGEFTGFTQNMTQRELQGEIDKFKSDPTHSRFDELSPTMAKLLQSEVAKDLAEAYQMADRLSPAASVQAPATTQIQPTVQSPAVQTKPTEPAQTGKAKLSITGSPQGSDPARRKSAGTIDEALDRAFSI